MKIMHYLLHMIIIATCLFILSCSTKNNQLPDGYSSICKSDSEDPYKPKIIREGVFKVTAETELTNPLERSVNRNEIIVSRCWQDQAKRLCGENGYQEIDTKTKNYIILKVEGQNLYVSSKYGYVICNVQNLTESEVRSIINKYNTEQKKK